MFYASLFRCGLATLLLSALVTPTLGQSFRVQCPTSTITHPVPGNNNSELAYAGPTYLPTTGTASDYTSGNSGHPVNGAIKCQQISGGDGYATMGDGTQTYLFSFGPLSGLGHIGQGLPGTEYPNIFNTPYPVSTSNPLVPGDPATTVDGLSPSPISGGFIQPLTATQLSRLGVAYNGAVGLDYNVTNSVNVLNISETGTTVTVVGYVPLDLNLKVGDQVVISGGTDLPAGYTNGGHPVTVTAINVANPFFPANYAFSYSVAPTSGLAAVFESSSVTASFPRALDGHVDPRQIMDVGVMNGNLPAPLMAIDEDDEFFLTLTNVGA